MVESARDLGFAEDESFFTEEANLRASVINLDHGIRVRLFRQTKDPIQPLACDARPLE